MSDWIVITIPGKPAGKGRPRFDPRSRRTYTDNATVSAEGRVLAAWAAAGQPRIDDGAIALTLEIVAERPKAHWKTDGTLSAAGERTPWPLRKPDVDNALKLTMDALNGALYRDDVDIVHAWVVRRWANPGETERTVVKVKPMPIPTGLREAA